MDKIKTNGVCITCISAIIATLLQVLKLTQVCWTVTAFLINGTSKAPVLSVVWVINDSVGFVVVNIFPKFM